MRAFTPTGFDWYALMHLREKLIRLMIDSTGMSLKEFYREVFGSRGFALFQRKLADPLEFKMWELRTLARGINRHNPFLVVTWMDLIEIVTYDLQESERKYLSGAINKKNRIVRNLKGDNDEVEKRLGKSYLEEVNRKSKL
jgi:hypothetical protein